MRPEEVQIFYQHGILTFQLRPTSHCTTCKSLGQTKTCFTEDIDITLNLLRRELNTHHSAVRRARNTGRQRGGLVQFVYERKGTEKKKMPVTILNPRPVPQRQALERGHSTSDSDSDSDGGADIQGDVKMGGEGMRASKRRRASHDDEDGDDDGDEILTPGTVITTNPQWMRYVSPPFFMLLFCPYFIV